MSEYNRMQLVKRRFFAMRNGIVADALRRLSPSYRMIFGLNLPQIAEVAASVQPDAAFAEELWADSRTRESLLVAPMIYPAAEMDEATALRWMCDVRDTEVADVLCHRLLRRLPFARRLAEGCASSESDMLRYTALRLMRNIMNQDAAAAAAMARRELDRDVPLTRALCLNIIDETEFLLEPDNEK